MPRCMKAPFICQACGFETADPNQVAAHIPRCKGRSGGLKTSRAKAKAARANGALGGRPRVAKKDSQE